MLGDVAWVAGPLLLVAGLAGVLVRSMRRDAETLRAALGGWFPFASSALCFERGGVVFRLERRSTDGGGWNVLTAQGARPGTFLIARAGAEQYFDFANRTVERVSRPGLQLVLTCDEPGLSAELGRLLSGAAGVSWGRLLPLDPNALSYGPQTRLGRGRGPVLKLQGISHVVWTAPPTQFLGQVDALLKLARLLALAPAGRSSD